MGLVDGLLVVDKPAGLTSHDVVGRVRRLAGTRKVGHAGTLDPMATGVLLVGVNRCTRLLTYLVGLDKTYTATIRLGQGTITDDAEGEITQIADPGLVAGLTGEAIVAAARTLTGDIMQVPSAVSAIKVKGVRSYHRVRAGQEVELPSRAVRVSEFSVGDPMLVQTPDGPVCDVPVVVSVSSGTYVRALARDLGGLLGVGGHLSALRRTGVGPFDLDQACRLSELADAPQLPLLGLAQVASAVLPVRHVDAAQARDLGFGRSVTVSGESGPVAALGPEGDLVAIVVDRDGRGCPQLVLMTSAATPGSQTSCGTT